MKLYYLFLALLTISITAGAQKTTKIGEETGEKGAKLKTEYYVLEENIEVKHGNYQKFLNGNLVLDGYYKMNKKDSLWKNISTRSQVLSERSYAENKRTGVWRFYKSDGKMEWQYDFNADTGTSVLRYEYVYLGENGEWVKEKADKDPQWLTSTSEWQIFLNRTLRYPAGALDTEAQGTPGIDVTVDENGDVIDYEIGKKVHSALDEEAMRIVKLFEFEFTPAVKNDKKVKSKVRIFITFRLVSR